MLLMVLGFLLIITWSMDLPSHEISSSFFTLKCYNLRRADTHIAGTFCLYRRDQLWLSGHWGVTTRSQVINQQSPSGGGSSVSHLILLGWSHSYSCFPWVQEVIFALLGFFSSWFLSSRRLYLSLRGDGFQKHGGRRQIVYPQSLAFSEKVSKRWGPTFPFALL